MASTSKNQFSSRSHAILSLYITQKHNGKIIESKVAYIDLAGSERISTSLNTG